jgi:Calcineurin-like phosphoesterase
MRQEKISRFKSGIAFSLTATMLAMIIVSLSGCASISKSPSVLPSVMFKFAVTADSRAAGGAAARSNGVSTVVLDAIAKDIVAQGVDFVLFPGDMVSGETDNSSDLISMLDTWKATMMPVYNAGIAVYVTRGNHEYNNPTHGARNPLDPSHAPFLAHFSMPTNGPESESGMTYFFIWKNAKVIAFDQYAGRTDAYNDTLYAPGSNHGQAMNSWVLDQINNSTSGVNFVMAHEQIFPTNSHPDCLANDPDSREALIHALGTHNGTYFAGHDHMYIRGTMTNAGGDKVPAFDVGTAGGGNYDYAAYDVVAAGYTGSDTYSVQQVFSDKAKPIFGYLFITVYSDNTWSGEFRGFRFKHWNDATDVSLTPITVMDSFTSSSMLH